MRDSAKLIAAFVLAFASCAGAQEEPNRQPGSPEVRPTQGPAAELVSVPRSVLSECLEAVEHEPACPQVLPKIEGRYKGWTFDTRGADYLLLVISFSAAYPQLTERNAPPRFVHIVIKAGHLTQGFPFSFPFAPASPADPPKHYPDAPLALERFTWGVKAGLLVHRRSFAHLGGVLVSDTSLARVVAPLGGKRPEPVPA